MSSNLNNEQMSAVLCDDKKILCLAGAGTGKTTTMLERISHLVDTGVDPSSILVLTFTNAAAFEMKDRYQKKHNKNRIPEFRTFHSFCYYVLSSNVALRRSLGYTETPTIADEAIRKRILREAGSITNIKSSIESLSKKTNRSVKEQYEYETLCKTASKLMQKRNTITFDELSKKVCELFQKDDPGVQVYKNQYRYIFVDEFQDTDPTQFKFIESFPDSKLFVVGDALQCQPAGTKVMLSDMREKNIEDLSVGDYVLTYAPREGRYIRNLNKRSGNLHRYTKRVINISTHLATNIVRVSSEHFSSCYTLDHLTYAKIHHEGNESSFVTYLMSNDQGWWRVGSTKLFLDSQGSAFGPRLRLQSEHGNKVWILGVYKSVNEAWMNEQIVAYKFGIPQATWNHENTSFTFEDLVKLYNELGDLSDKAISCLAYYGRDILYPMFTKTDLHVHFSKLHMFECRVGNLIPGIFDLVYTEARIDPSGYPGLHNAYEVITSVTKEPDQIVYGLEVEDYHNYVGDGILTHNCIYSFRGADSSIIKKLSTDPEWTTIKLHKNYRSPSTICDFANEHSKHASSSFRVDIVSGKEKVGQPVVERKLDDFIHDDLYPQSAAYAALDIKGQPGSTAILCRTNKEVSAIQEYFTENGYPFRTQKKSEDVKNMLISAGDNEFLIDWLSSYLNAERYMDYIRILTLRPEDQPYTVTEFINDFGGSFAVGERWNTIRTIRRICKDSSRSIVDRCQDILDIIQCKNLMLNSSKCLTMKDALNHIIECYEGVQEDPGTDVYIGTIHSVKGLEFDNVYVMGVGGQTFKLIGEENLNLYYVAITRAKQHLVVFVRDWSVDK